MNILTHYTLMFYLKHLQKQKNYNKYRLEN